MGLGLVVAGAAMWLATPWAMAKEVKQRPAKPLVAQATTGVTIVDFAFQPDAVTVTAGDTVTWTNTAYAHTVSSDDGTLFDSGVLGMGQQFSFTFANAGTVTYHCNIHPFMTASVTVNAPETTTTPATTEPPTSQPTGTTTPGSTAPGGTTPGTGGTGGTSGTAGTTGAGGNTTTAAGANATTVATAGDPSPQLANSGIPASVMALAGVALLLMGAALLRASTKLR